MTEKKPMDGNQGEGNREAARVYDEEQKKFVEAGKVDKAAEEAKAAVEGGEGDELRKAEEEGKSHGKS